MSLSQLLNEPAIGVGNALAEANARPPSQCGQSADVQQFARGAIWFARVQHDLTFVTDGIRYQPRKVNNWDIDPGTDVDGIDIGVVFQQKDQRIRAVVHMQKFTARLSSSPDRHL